ncbi:unnamed protein product, partial [Rotaria sp. Silwood2]
MELPLATTTEK